MTSPDPLAPLRDEPHASAILTDFDGTLSEIVDDPAAARPVDGASELLGRLAGKYHRVGIVSGRPAAFLLRWFGGQGLLLSGLYGLEQAVNGADVAVHPDAEAWRAVVAEAADRADDAGPDGMLVERKGLSVTLHYRTDPESEAAVRAWAIAEAARTGLAPHEARMSVELRPPVERSKGTAVTEAATGLHAVCFIGDDRGDLEAFDALDALARDGVTAVRVAVTSAEAPTELVDRADITVDGPAGTLRLLESLLEA